MTRMKQTRQIFFLSGVKASFIRRQTYKNLRNLRHLQLTPAATRRRESDDATLIFSANSLTLLTPHPDFRYISTLGLGLLEVRFRPPVQVVILSPSFQNEGVYEYGYKH